MKKLFADEILEGVSPDGGASGGASGQEVAPADAAGVRKLDVDKVVIPDRFYQRLAKVVYIIEKKHSRVCMGYLKIPNGVSLFCLLGACF